jgi:hypothetical protein
MFENVPDVEGIAANPLRSGRGGFIMKRIRIGASIVGILFGLGNTAWALFILATNSMMHGLGTPVSEIIPLIFVPLSFIAATAVGWKFARVAGWWLIVGGVGMAMTTPRVLASIKRGGGGGWGDLIWVFVLPVILPMLGAGALWFLYDSKARSAIAAK